MAMQVYKAHTHLLLAAFVAASIFIFTAGLGARAQAWGTAWAQDVGESPAGAHESAGAQGPAGGTGQGRASGEVLGGAQVLGALSAQQEPSEASRLAIWSGAALKWVQDVLARSFDATGWAVLLVGAGGVAVLRRFCDKRVQCYMKSLPEGSRLVLVPLDLIGWGGPGLMMIAAQWLWWQQPMAAASHFTGGLCAFMLTHALKQIVERARPSQKNMNSFPSGHATVAFSSATHIWYQYGGPWGPLAFVLASAVGWQRLRVNKHWLSDVFAGAIIAFIFARGASSL